MKQLEQPRRVLEKVTLLIAYQDEEVLLSNQVCLVQASDKNRFCFLKKTDSSINLVAGIFVSAC